MKHLPAYLMLTVFLIIGLLSYNKYGIAWDEEAQREIGLASYNWLHTDQDYLKTFTDRDYGVALELPLIYAENLLNLTELEDVYYTRHLIAHILFLLTGLVFYFLVINLYRNKWLAVAAMFLYLMHPVLYAHSFFNTKDIPSMGMYVVCFYVLLRYMKSGSYRNLMLLAFCSGVLVNLRLTGVIFVGIVGLLLLLKVLEDKNIKGFILHGALYLICSFSFLCLTWPYVLYQPFVHLPEAFKNMMSFRWEGEVVYLGEKVMSTNLPWHYLPTWIGITNSVVLIFSFIVGILILCYHLLSKRAISLKKNTLRFNFLVLAGLIVSISSVLILKPVMYDSWRQFFYLYPFILLVIIYFLNILFQHQKLKYLAIGIISYSVVHYSYNIVQLFPYSQVYFSELVSKSEHNGIRTQFEMDYWGTIYREATEYILEIDSGDKIKIQSNSGAFYRNVKALSLEKAARIDYVWNDADYFISCFRYNPQGHDSLENATVVYEIERMNNVIGIVYKLTPDKRNTN